MSRKRTYISNSHIEIINPSISRGQIKFALFDFDGTISLIRAGWQQIMIPMMVDILSQMPTKESSIEIKNLVEEFVSRTTGKQTIYQMIGLAEEVEKRGGSPQEPLYYKRIYHDRLMNHINGRLEGLRNGRFQPKEWMVPGSSAVLERLNKFKISCFLASGTDKEYVLDEAELLGVTEYFQGIYGAVDDYKNFSKELVIKQIITENKLTGPELIAFGDGYVEIKNTKSVGGIAIGLATNESERQGVDEWKRERLISSGADIIMPDFQQYQILLDYLWEEA